MTEPTYGGKTAAELTTLHERATAGPWVSLADQSNAVYDVISVAGDGVVEICRSPQSDDRPNDMALIAAARNALPDLIAAVARLQARNEYLEAELLRYSYWRENALSAHRDLWDVEL